MMVQWLRFFYIRAEMHTAVTKGRRCMERPKN